MTQGARSEAPRPRADLNTWLSAATGPAPPGRDWRATSHVMNTATAPRLLTNQRLPKPPMSSCGRSRVCSPTRWRACRSRLSTRTSPPAMASSELPRESSSAPGTVPPPALGRTSSTHSVATHRLELPLAKSSGNSRPRRVRAARVDGVARASSGRGPGDDRDRGVSSRWRSRSACHSSLSRPPAPLLGPCRSGL